MTAAAPAEADVCARPDGTNGIAGRLPAKPCSRWGTVMTGLSHQEKRQIFERNSLLGKLSSDEIDKLLAYSRVEHYPAGQEIFAKGSPGNAMMLVLRGSVKICSISLGGREIVLNIINAGEIVGEIGLLDGGERSGDAVAKTDCELLVLNRRDFMPFLENHADICLILIRILCKRLRRTSEQVEDLLFLHLESRIAKALLELSERSGRPEVEDRLLELHLSQSELGSIVGSSRESVNKQLMAWQKAGLVDIAKGLIVIRDPEAIEELI
jgi:CRP/FNR family transcriptional regulator, cyclic AMP receptor protein